MKKRIPLIIGVLGAGLVIFGATQGWTGWTQKFGGGMTFSTPGIELWQGIGAAVMAVAALVMMFVQKKYAWIPGIVAILLAAFVYFVPPKELYKPQLGIYITMGGGLLSALAGFLVRNK